VSVGGGKDTAAAERRRALEGALVLGDVDERAPDQGAARRERRSDDEQA